MDIGVFQNHTVANGQNTESWVKRPRKSTHLAVMNLLENPDPLTQGLYDYLVQLHEFLETIESDNIEIRHHYAWWYPKWFDLLMAGLR